MGKACHYFQEVNLSNLIDPQNLLYLLPENITAFTVNHLVAFYRLFCSCMTSQTYTASQVIYTVCVCVCQKLSFLRDS